MSCLLQLTIIYKVEKFQHYDNLELVFSGTTIVLCEIYRDLYICKEQNIIRLKNR